MEVGLGVGADKEFGCLEATIMVEKLVDTSSNTTLPIVNKIFVNVVFYYYGGALCVTLTD